MCILYSYIIIIPRTNTNVYVEMYLNVYIIFLYNNNILFFLLSFIYILSLPIINVKYILLLSYIFYIYSFIKSIKFEFQQKPTLVVVCRFLGMFPVVVYVMIGLFVLSTSSVETNNEKQKKKK